MSLPPRQQRLLLAATLLGWSVSMVLCQMYLGQGRDGTGLLWNLFLAALPLGWSAGFGAAMARQKRVWALVWFALWILFLPNAPYLLTDVMHLSQRPPVPFWFILAMLLSCAATGTLLGYLSLMEVHAVIERKWGAPAAWIVAIGALMSCGFGIYLGRFLRWNSWDAFTRPLQLMQTIVHQFTDAGPHPHPLSVTLVYGGGLVIGYVALRVISGNRTDF